MRVTLLASCPEGLLFPDEVIGGKTNGQSRGPAFFV